MIYLCNGLSQSMLRDPNTKQVPFSLTEDEFTKIILNGEWISVIGHEDLAECLTRITGVNIPYYRRGIMLNYDDIVLLVSLNGRLPEHPTHVEYKNRLNFSFIRFEKQSTDDLLTSQLKINEIIKMGEI